MKKFYVSFVCIKSKDTIMELHQQKKKAKQALIKAF